MQTCYTLLVVKLAITIKVERNTLYHERGKYAMLCIEVEHNKPFLAMFELKVHVYKSKYEGFHMLCFTHGKFGHYMLKKTRKIKMILLQIMCCMMNKLSMKKERRLDE